MAIDTASYTIFERLSLSKLIQRLSFFMEEYYTIKANNTTEFLLTQFVELLESILGERCQHVYSKGRNKDSKCLKACWLNPTFEVRSQKCGVHTNQNFKKEHTPVDLGSVRYDSNYNGYNIFSQSLESKSTTKKRSKSSKKKRSETSKDTSLADQFDPSKIEWGPPSTPPSKKIFQEYYPNQNDLYHLYDNIYLDTTNVVVQKSTDSHSNCRWYQICKYISDKQTLKKFTDTVFTELEIQMRLKDYNYVIREELKDTLDLNKIIEAMNDKQESTGNAQEKTQNPPSKSIDQSPSKLVLQTEAEKIDRFRAYSRVPKIVLYDEDYMDSSRLFEVTRKRGAEKARIQAEKERDQAARLSKLDRGPSYDVVVSKEIESDSSVLHSEGNSNDSNNSDTEEIQDHLRDPIYQEWLAKQNKGLTSNPYGEEYRPTMEFPGCEFEDEC